MKYHALFSANVTGGLTAWKTIGDNEETWEACPAIPWETPGGVALAGNSSKIAVSGDGMWAVTTKGYSTDTFRIILLRRDGDQWRVVSTLTGSDASGISYSGNDVSMSYNGEWILFQPNATGPVRVLHRVGTVLTEVDTGFVYSSNSHPRGAVSPDGKWFYIFTSASTAVLLRRTGETFEQVALSPEPNRTPTNCGVFSADSKFFFGFIATTVHAYALTDGPTAVSVANYVPSSEVPATNAPRTLIEVGDKLFVLYAGSTTAHGARLQVIDFDPVALTITRNSNNVITVSSTADQPTHMAVAPSGLWMILFRPAMAYPGNMTVYEVVYTDDVVSLVNRSNGLGVVPSINGLQHVTFGPELIVGEVTLYDGALLSLLAGTVDRANLKMALLSASAVFNPAHTQLTQVTAGGFDEIVTADWPAGGKAMANAHYTPVGSDVMLVSDPVNASVLAADLVFARAVIYDNTSVNKRPIMFVEFGSTRTVAVGEQVEFQATTDGLLLFER